VTIHQQLADPARETSKASTSGRTIAGRQRLGGLLKEELDQATSDVDGRVARRSRRVLGRVRDDDPLGTLRSSHRYGDVGRQTAVGQKPAIA
jgi:hypothetical protein